MSFAVRRIFCATSIPRVVNRTFSKDSHAVTRLGDLEKSVRGLEQRQTPQKGRLINVEESLLDIFQRHVPKSTLELLNNRSLETFFSAQGIGFALTSTESGVVLRIRDCRSKHKDSMQIYYLQERVTKIEGSLPRLHFTPITELSTMPKLVDFFIRTIYDNEDAHWALLLK